MSRVLINIRGCNGSGKSTIPISMMDDENLYVVSKPYKGKQKKILTVFPKYNFIALGSYSNKSGGLDLLNCNSLIRKVLLYTLKKFPEYDILMEGAMVSSIYSTYRDLLIEAQENFDVTCAVMNFVPPLDVAISRVYSRNGGKPINENRIAQRHKTATRDHDKFISDGIQSIEIDTSLYEKDEMLPMFLTKVKKFKRRGKF